MLLVGEKVSFRTDRQRDRHVFVQLADEIMLISIISLILIFAHAPVRSSLICTNHAQ